MIWHLLLINFLLTECGEDEEEGENINSIKYFRSDYKSHHTYHTLTDFHTQSRRGEESEVLFLLWHEVV